MATERGYGEVTGQVIWDTTKKWWHSHSKTPKGLVQWAVQIEDEFVPFLDFLIGEGVTKILEIGTYWYGTAAMFRQLGEVWTNDIHCHCPAIIEELGLHFIHGDSRAVVDQILPHAPFDLLFIDGSHLYNDAKADWMNYKDMARIVAFHDIHHHTPTCDVPQLWEEIKSSPSSSTMEFYVPQRGVGYGIGVVR